MSVPGTGAPSRYATGMPQGPSLDSVSRRFSVHRSRRPTRRCIPSSARPPPGRGGCWSSSAALLALLWVVEHLEVIVVPVVLATMLTRDADAGRRLPRPPRPAARRGGGRWSCSAGFVVVGGILTFVVSQFIEGAPALVEQVTKASPMPGARSPPACCHTSATSRSTSATDAAIDALKNNQAKLTSGALSTAGTITEILTGALLVFFTLIFLLLGRPPHLRLRHARSSRRPSAIGCATPAARASTR